MTAPRTQPTVAERALTSYNALLPVVYPTHVVSRLRVGGHPALSQINRVNSRSGFENQHGSSINVVIGIKLLLVLIQRESSYRIASSDI